MPGAGMGRTAEELKGMGRSYFGCRLVQFGCRQVTRNRCLVGHWKFKIEALLLSCTPPHAQLCTDVSWCPTSCSSMV